MCIVNKYESGFCHPKDGQLPGKAAIDAATKVGTISTHMSGRHYRCGHGFYSKYECVILNVENLRSP